MSSKSPNKMPAEKRARPSRAESPAARAEAAPSSAWTFLTNHAHVLLCLSENPELSLRDVSLRVGITERSVQRIVSELEEDGYLLRERVGRSNRYAIKRAKKLRHPIESHCTIGDLIAMVFER